MVSSLAQALRINDSSSWNQFLVIGRSVGIMGSYQHLGHCVFGSDQIALNKVRIYYEDLHVLHTEEDYKNLCAGMNFATRQSVKNQTHSKLWNFILWSL